MRRRLDCRDTTHSSFCLTATTTTEIYTLSLHDALPIFRRKDARARRRQTCWPRSCRRTSRRAPRSPKPLGAASEDRKSTRLNSSHVEISYAVFCLKKKINGHKQLGQRDELQRVAHGAGK